MKVVIASQNPGKIRELAQLFAPLHIEVLSQADLRIKDQPECAKTFVENALQKARHVTAHAKLPAIADDSGLVVPALGGAPGIYSARFSGENKDAKANIKKLLTLMQDFPNEERKAYFYCALVYMTHADDPTPMICTGIWQGEIARVEKGEDGFGYDPIFYLPELHKTAAELSPEVKNKISHRGLAFQSLFNFFRDHS